MESYDKAQKQLTEAHRIFTQLKNGLNAAKCLNSLGQIYFKKGEIEQAEKHSQKALDFFIKHNYKIDASRAYQTLGSCSMKKKQSQKAIQYYKNSFAIDSLESNYLELVETCTYLKNGYAEIEDYKNAYYFSDLYKAYSDSIYNTETTDKFSELEVRYETAQKEQKIELLEKKKEILDTKAERDFWIITGLILLFISSVIISFLIISKQRLKAQQRTAEVEQKLFRVQMNPHFIFNAIFAIQSFMLENDSQKSSLYLSNFAKLMRMILESSRQEKIRLSQELKMIEYYIGFQQLRSTPSFDYKIHISENIDPENTLIPPMLVQPFIENAVEHGFSNNSENALIEINFILKKDIIFVTIKDNGKGISENKKKKKHKSLATEITKERLSLILNKKGKKNIEFSIRDLSSSNSTITGTEVRFKIPFEEEF